jgi:hypothetical protein
MKLTPIEFIFSNTAKVRRRRPQQQVELIIPIECCPLIISCAGDAERLHAVGLDHTTERKRALRFRLYPEDIFAKGPRDIDVRKDNAYVRITVRDVAGLLPDTEHSLPLQIFGTLLEEIESFTVQFGY